MVIKINLAHLLFSLQDKNVGKDVTFIIYNTFLRSSLLFLATQRRSRRLPLAGLQSHLVVIDLTTLYLILRIFSGLMTSSNASSVKKTGIYDLFKKALDKRLWMYFNQFRT